MFVRYIYVYYCINQNEGTENVALAVGLGEASVIALKEAYLMLIHLLTLKHRFIEALLKGISKVIN